MGRWGETRRKRVRFPMRIGVLDMYILVEEYKRMVAPFRALAEPSRRRIVAFLRTRERLVGEVVEGLDIPQPSVSKHLKALERAGLVSVRKDAQRRWYRLELEPLIELDQWLAPYRQLWASRLDALEHHLDQMEDT